LPWLALQDFHVPGALLAALATLRPRLVLRPALSTEPGLSGGWALSPATAYRLLRIDVSY